jgi:hypothetical protein
MNMETDKKIIETPYRIWIGGRRTGYRDFLRYLAEAGIKVVEVKEPENKPRGFTSSHINWTEDEF